MRLKQQIANVAIVKDNKSHQVKKQEVVVKPNMPSNSGPGRPLKPSTQQKVNNNAKSQQKSDKGAIQKRTITGQQNVSKNLL
jgi:hypothetical protein